MGAFGFGGDMLRRGGGGTGWFGMFVGTKRRER